MERYVLSDIAASHIWHGSLHVNICFEMTSKTLVQIIGIKCVWGWLNYAYKFDDTPQHYNGYPFINKYLYLVINFKLGNTRRKETWLEHRCVVPIPKYYKSGYNLSIDNFWTAVSSGIWHRLVWYTFTHDSEEYFIYETLINFYHITE
jgi:hypothetical protein